VEAALRCAHGTGRAAVIAGIFALVACGGSTPHNMIQDQAFSLKETYWKASSSRIRIASSTSSQPARIVYVGTGRPSGYEYVASAPIVVEPGRVYTLSGHIDASHVISGKPEWAVSDETVHQIIAAVAIDNGLEADVSVSFQVPPNIRLLRVVCDTVDAVVATGTTLSFWQPALIEGGAMPRSSQAGAVK